VGKPLGQSGDLATHSLSWSGTVEEAMALGEQMRAIVP
jgi:hypothetical protein